MHLKASADIKIWFFLWYEAVDQEMDLSTFFNTRHNIPDYCIQVADLYVKRIFTVYRHANATHIIQYMYVECDLL